MKTKKNYRRYGIPAELELTDRLGSVVGQRKKRRFLPVLFFPFRILVGFWNWLLETKPKKEKNKHFRMPPPGLD
jgi:hypothetical protein